MFGKRHSDEAKRKIGAAHKGRKRSAEARENMSKAQQLRFAKAREAGLLKGSRSTAVARGSTHGSAGRKQDPEWIAKRTAARSATMRAKREAREAVACLDNGEG
jgi:hypothetical protein